MEGNQVVMPAENCGVDDVFTMFAGKLKPKQIMCTYRLCDDSFDATVECLLEGPTLDSLLKTLNRKYKKMPVTKLYLDQDDMWSDTVAFYKSPSCLLQNQIRIVLNHQPAVDTGGVRRHVFTEVFGQFADNKSIKLFDGLPHSLRPRYSAESRCSGLFKVLGK